MQLTAASDSSLLVAFGDAISPELNRGVVRLFRRLRRDPDPRIVNLHPAYATLLIDFDPLRLSFDELRERVSRLVAESAGDAADAATEPVKVPVCYGGELGPDLEDVAEHCHLSPEEVVSRHSGTVYMVYFLGFSPGFPYMGRLPEELATPRLKTPRTSIPAGSVGIGGSQTGLYPMQWSGGWRLIGRTPLRMFDPAAEPPSRLQAGDLVKFESISREEFERYLKEEQSRATSVVEPRA